jgi:hypothetical protein
MRRMRTGGTNRHIDATRVPLVVNYHTQVW